MEFLISLIILFDYQTKIMYEDSYNSFIYRNDAMYRTLQSKPKDIELNI